MKSNRQRLIFVFLLFILVVTPACAIFAPTPMEPTTSTATTPMQIVHERVYDGSVNAWSSAKFWAPFGWAVFGLIIVTILFALMSQGESVGLGFLVGLGVALFLFISVRSSIVNQIPASAEKQAVHAMVEGIDESRFNKANVYMEVIHVPVVAANFDTMECTKSVDRRSNCYPYEWTHEINYRTVCDSRDDETGACTSSHQESDTEHVPYFTTMVRYRVIVSLYEKLATPETGLVSSGVEHFPQRWLSDWLLPVDFDNYWRSDRRMNISPSDYQRPSDWIRWNEELSRGEIPVVNVYHKYVNWLWATDNVYAVGEQQRLADYEAAGLLPTMNQVYSRINTGWAADYDFIQFVGSLEVDDVTHLAWQDAMYDYVSYFANERQGSLTIVFGSENEVAGFGSVIDWANSMESHYSQRGKWDFSVGGETLQRLMPKNQFILGCTVSDDNIVTACALVTAMPRGNEQVIDAFMIWNDPALQNVAFTPQGFFGDIRTQLVPTTGPYSVVEIAGLGNNPMSLLLREDPFGLRRISMDDYDYLQADVKLEPADIDNLVQREVQAQQNLANKRVSTAFWALGILILLILLLLGGTMGL